VQRLDNSEILSEAGFTLPPTLPITEADLKLFGKIDIADDDTIITMLARSATEKAQLYTNLCFIDQPVEVFYQQHLSEIELPYGPNQDTFVVSRVENGVETSLTLNSDYFITGNKFKILLIKTVVRSSGYLNVGLKVTYNAGYGANPADVPDIAREAIAKAVATNYYNRQNTKKGSYTILPNSSKVLLDQISRNPGF